MKSLAEYWQNVMDYHKLNRARARFIETAAIYGRAEMMARAELEMAEAQEKAARK